MLKTISQTSFDEIYLWQNRFSRNQVFFYKNVLCVKEVFIRNAGWLSAGGREAHTAATHTRCIAQELCRIAVGSAPGGKKKKKKAFHFLNKEEGSQKAVP